jgi:hypothetical protein
MTGKSQVLIGTPTSMYLVFNYPGNSFYIEIKGVDKKKTNNRNIFTIDGKLVEVLSIKTSKFMRDTIKQTTDKEILNKYVNWEKDYLTKLYSTKIDCEIEFLKTTKGKDYIFWTYTMPIKTKESILDSSRANAIKKKLYVSAVVGKYIVGAYTECSECDETFNNSKKFISDIMESITTSERKINPEELSRKVNK